MHQGDTNALEGLLDHIIDEGVGVILDTHSFDALHARLRELMRPLAQAIVSEAGDDADDNQVDLATRAIATRAALDLWNHTPIPDNHFRPYKMDKPERNAPCPCGSLRKYKQCCGAVESPSLELPPDEMVARVLKRLPRERIGEIHALGVPVLTLGLVAETWLGQQRFDDIVALLEPVFKEVRELDERAELAADVLGNAWLALGDEARRLQLIATLKSAPDKTLRSAAFQREAVLKSDLGDFPAAWAAFGQAQRLTPNNPTLAHLEVLLLLAEGREAEARARVDFWAAKLARDPEFDHSERIGLLYEMLDIGRVDERLAALPEDYPERRLLLHVELEGIEPPIWRRLEVENSLSFAELHDILQTAMGWDDAHLHEFIVGKYRIGPTTEVEAAWDEPALPGDEVELGQVIGRRKSFRYLYDFGDGWSHRITIEQRLPSTPTERPAALLAGKRACPPEDCGGVPGYYRLLDAQAEPDSDENRETLEWLGDYKPEAFNLASLRKAVASLFTPI
jgi:tetratricopeptide (TPR) repeat protein